MGFYFRKSVGFGPFRLNFSKSGVGASFGVRGARISSGPRGTYINVGRDGFYYRQKIDSPGGSPGSSQPAQPSQPTGEPAGNIGTADVDKLVDSSSEELVRQINACAARIRYAPLLALAFVIMAITGLAFTSNTQETAVATSVSATQLAQAQLDAASKARAAATAKGLKAKDRKTAEDNLRSIEAKAEDARKQAAAAKIESDRVAATMKQANILMLILGGLGAVSIVFVHRRDVVARLKLVTYDLDDRARAKFKILEEGCGMLSKVKRVWRIETQQATSDWKRNAGANALVSRSVCQIGKAVAPNIQSSLVPWSIDCGSMKCFFFPDHVFVYQSGRYGVVPYKSMAVGVSYSHYRETEQVPSDAKVVGRTWRYVRKDRGPDRRFAANQEIPIVHYVALDIRSPQGFRLLLQASSVFNATGFADAIETYGGHRPVETEQPPPPPRNEQSRQRDTRPPSPSPASKSAFEVLGVPTTASKEEIKVAYYHMAQQYHPDKVATLAPEFKELAERRMKEINAAYTELQHRS